MKSYPTIPHHSKGYLGEPCYIFDKLDGSNIRAAWSKKRGFYKFGTRNQLIDHNGNGFWARACAIFEREYVDLPLVFKDEYRNIENFTCFFEYWGEESFAGNHNEQGEMFTTLFDVSAYKKGFIQPKEFIKNFEHLGIPQWTQGNFNKDLIQTVQNNSFGWSLKEGVVCKGVRKNLIWMSKIKTQDWLDRLKNKFGDKALEEEMK